MAAEATEARALQYHLTDDQVQMRNMVAAFLADRYDHHTRERILKAPGHWSPEIWNMFANDLGLLGLTIPEAAGGFGGTPVDTLLVMDAFGEALVVEPFLETCVIAPVLLRRSSAAVAPRLLAQIANGTARLVLAWAEEGARFAPLRVATNATRSGQGFLIEGGKIMVIGAPAATHLLVTAVLKGTEGLALFLVPSDHPSITMRAGRTLDGKGVAMVTFRQCAVEDGALVIGPAEGATAIAEAMDAASAALCAEAAGIARRLIRDTLSYLEQRRQFGSALIDFQVLQHRLADMQVSYEQIQAVAFFAAGMLAEPDQRRAAGISAAKAFVGTALRAVAQEAVQMHGAMGITEELSVGHLFKRATVLENEFGSVDYHLDRVIEIGLPDQSLA